MDLKRALLLSSSSSSRRGIFRSTKNLVNDQRGKRQGKSNVMGALEMAKRQGLVYEQSTKDNNGVVRIRMVVKKSELEKLIIMHGHGGDGDGYDDVSSPSLVEQRLKQLRRKHIAKNSAGKKGISWAPALRSIPEEF